MTAVQKHNEHGKVQPRLLVVSDQAVYNLSSDGKKCKRRIPLTHVSLVTASESAGQFILHVPSEYDYHFAAPSRGYAPSAELGTDTAVAGAPLAAIIAALQRVYAAHAPSGQHLPVRTVEGPLAALVKKKKSVHGGFDETGMAGLDIDDDD